MKPLKESFKKDHGWRHDFLIGLPFVYIIASWGGGLQWALLQGDWFDHIMAVFAYGFLAWALNFAIEELQFRIFDAISQIWDANWGGFGGMKGALLFMLLPNNIVILYICYAIIFGGILYAIYISRNKILGVFQRKPRP